MRQLPPEDPPAFANAVVPPFEPFRLILPVITVTEEIMRTMPAPFDPLTAVAEAEDPPEDPPSERSVSVAFPAVVPPNPGPDPPTPSTPAVPFPPPPDGPAEFVPPPPLPFAALFEAAPAPDEPSPWNVPDALLIAEDPPRKPLSTAVMVPVTVVVPLANQPIKPPTFPSQALAV